MAIRYIFMILVAAILLTACGSAPADNDGLKVVASTTLVGDVVREVGGEHIDLRVLLPVGVDPHTFEPRPQDMAALSEAQLVFINGLGLEEALKPSLDANVKGRVVEVSQGIEALPFDSGHEGDTDGSEEDEHATGDPHTWMDPGNTIIWTQNIAAALAQADPANAGSYQAKAEVYIKKLKELDGWIRQQVEQVPGEQRKLVTDHAVLAYFAKEYGFEQVGLVVPALSTNASPSAQELAGLEDAIRELGLRAIFVSKEVNPATSEQVAQDTGVKLVSIYSGSLGEPGSGAETYLDWMHYKVNAIVEALK
jgi:ABC-type Zn uptake system ZnuABC Zn-binding protein ZnuA